MARSIVRIRCIIYVFDVSLLVDVCLCHCFVLLSEFIKYNYKVKAPKKHKKIEQPEKKMGALQKKLEAQEQYSRRNNLKTFGLSEVENENATNTAIDFFMRKMKVDVSSGEVDCCHRLPGRKHPLIVKFIGRQKIPLVVFKNKQMLRGKK